MTRLERAALALGNKLHRTPLGKVDLESAELEAAAIDFARLWRERQAAQLKAGLRELRDAEVAG